MNTAVRPRYDFGAAFRAFILNLHGLGVGID